MFHHVFFDIFEAQSKRKQLRGILTAQCTHCALVLMLGANIQNWETEKLVEKYQVCSPLSLQSTTHCSTAVAGQLK